MKIAIILNGISPLKGYFNQEVLPSLDALFTTHVFETTTAADAERFAQQIAGNNYDYVAAAGGDGTVNQVVNGLLASGLPADKLPVLLVIPLGTGNDFCRVLGISSLHLFLNILMSGQPCLVDVGKVTYDDNKSRYFINVFDTGMGPIVVERMRPISQWTGRVLSYYVSILYTFLTYKSITISAIAGNFTWNKPIRTFALANGKYFGNNLCVAPEAALDDQKLNLFAVGNVSILDFLIHSRAMLKGKYVSHADVKYLDGISEMEITSTEKAPFEIDGEWIGYLPVKVKILPKMLRVLKLKTEAERVSAPSHSILHG